DDPARRDQIFARATAEQARDLDEDHPELLETVWLRSAMTVRFDRALELLVPTCAGLETVGGWPALRCWQDVGFIRGELNELGTAAEAMSRAASTRTRAAPSRTLEGGYLRLWRGDAPGAAR